MDVFDGVLLWFSGHRCVWYELDWLLTAIEVAAFGVAAFGVAAFGIAAMVNEWINIFMVFISLPLFSIFFELFFFIIFIHFHYRFGLDPWAWIMRVDETDKTIVHRSKWTIVMVWKGRNQIKKSTKYDVPNGHWNNS